MATPSRKRSAASGLNVQRKARSTRNGVATTARHPRTSVTEKVPARANVNQAQERTEFLISTLGTGAAVADLLGVNRSQPTQWRKGVESPSPEVGRGLLDLDHVVARASMLWAPESVLAWLTGANSFLEGATPIDVLRTRGSREVIEALDAELAGSYA